MQLPSKWAPPLAEVQHYTVHSDQWWYEAVISGTATYALCGIVNHRKNGFIQATRCYQSFFLNQISNFWRLTPCFLKTLLECFSNGGSNSKIWSAQVFLWYSHSYVVDFTVVILTLYLQIQHRWSLLESVALCSLEIELHLLAVLKLVYPYWALSDLW